MKNILPFFLIRNKYIDVIILKIRQYIITLKAGKISLWQIVVNYYL